MLTSFRGVRKSVVAVIAATLAATLAQFPVTARADTKPANESDPTTPVTVSVDPLPTVQIDGVAWTQLVVGNTVYVGGSFTTARPAGAAPGTNTVTRSNLLAYDITTGVLNTTWAPSANGDVLALAVSPDKSRIYIGGSFTNVNGVTRNRIAALNATTGALDHSFQPKADASVKAIAVTADKVYFGGVFGSVGGVSRTKVAAAQAADGALLSWAPTLAGGNVNALAISPDGKVILGGAFTSVNGSSNPGYGLGAVDPETGASLAFPANTLIRNGGSQAAILSFSSDSDSLYATGYTYGSGGRLEGTTRIRWSDLGVEWVEDCHGDTYSSFPMGDVVYTSTHAHYCGNLPDGPPQTNPWTFHWGLAFTKSAQGVLKADPLGYFNFAGTPSPYLLKWEPQMASGTYTGQGQASWSVSGNDKYIVYGGEFPRTGASNTTQQGLVRYAVRDVAPNKIGPEVTGAKLNPTATSYVTGQVRLTWTANWDRDNEFLTYKIIRDGVTNSPVHTVTAPSSEWSRPGMGYVDTGLVPGQTYRYRLFVSDPWGNEARSDTVYVTASTEGDLSPYADAVLGDGATSYWRFGETPAATANDWAGFTNAAAGSGVAGGAPGAIIGDSNSASTFNGTTNGFAVNVGAARQAPDTFSVEAWFKTTSSRGGKIIGFGNASSGSSGSYDRHVYMTNQGRITFGAYPGAVRTVTSSKAYNDGQWHHAVASLGSNGMVLYVDGQRVDMRTDTTGGQSYAGFWRIGGDNLGGWTNVGDQYFNGSIDEVAVYPTQLTAKSVRQHYLSSGRTLPGVTPPADDYGAAVHASEPEFFWRLSDPTGNVVTDASPNQVLGTYNTGVSRGGASAVGVAADASVTFNGATNGTAATQQSYVNPTVFSQELWFKTTTTRGGKLIGFGSSQTGGSGSYDRHTYMIDNGRLRFGIWTGSASIVESAKSYNDGKWHYLVTQLDAGGIKMFVDNELVGSAPQSTPQNYTGYWRIGGDTTWGGNSSNYFAGGIDEVALYARVLSDSERLDHFLKGGGKLPNVAPSVDFSFEVNKLKVKFESESTDSDGSVSSYLWDFGDGNTSMEADPEHTYASVGERSVTLTVTDNEGATGSVTKQVTPVSNTLPTASFETEITKKKVKFTSDATDADGTVESYLWDFGDGSATSTQKNPVHDFPDVGTYQVSLTVTDNDGGATTVAQPVITKANVAPVADFTHVVDKRSVSFDGETSVDSDGTIASYLWNFGDGSATSTQAKPVHEFPAADTYQVTLTVTDDDGATAVIEKSVTTTANAKPEAKFTAEVTDLVVEFDGSGSTDADGTISSYAWNFGDGSNGTGAKPSHTYAEPGTYDVTLVVTDSDGATDTVTHEVEAVAPVGPLAVDAFGRTTANGWGSADTGGAWSRYGTAALFSVSQGQATMRLATAGAGPRMALESVSSANSEASVKFTMDKVPNGGGAFISVGARTIGTSDYRAKVKIASSGQATLYLVRVVNNAETQLSSVVLGSAYTFTVGTTYNVKVQATGSSPTTVRAKVWKTTQTEPTAWQLSSTDNTSGLQQAGGVGLVSYISGTSTNMPVVVSFSEFLATRL